jgi:hypothetical protein
MSVSVSICMLSAHIHKHLCNESFVLSVNIMRLGNSSREDEEVVLMRICVKI